MHQVNSSKAPTRSIRRNQVLSDIISWKNRAFKPLWVTKNLTQLQVVMGTNPGLHDDPAVADHLGLDRDFVAILISCFRHFEHGEDRRGNNKNCIIDKVTSRTNPLPNAIYQ
jgi:hypothetical protein